MHKHHTNHHVIGVLCGILLLGSAMGGLGVLLGQSDQPFIERASALREKNVQRMQQLRSARLNRRKSLQHQRGKIGRAHV